MSDFSIRITHRAGALERTVEIDGAFAPTIAEAPAALQTNAQESVPASMLEWSGTICDGKKVDFAAAEKASAALGNGWRLPTRFELESILDLTRSDPAADTVRFPDTESDWYWTSTPYASSSDYAWCVLFGNGFVSSYHRDDVNAFVRAVRSVPAGQ
jgi:hypothetical protein